MNDTLATILLMIFGTLMFRIGGLAGIAVSLGISLVSYLQGRAT